MFLKRCPKFSLKSINHFRKLVLILSLSLIGFFQNCGDVRFYQDQNSNVIPFNCVENSSPEIEPILKYNWSADNELFPEWKYVMATPSVGDLNADGVPEIVFTTFTMNKDLAPNHYRGNGILRVISGDTGTTIASIGSDELAPFASTTPLIIDLDGNGQGEIIYPHYSLEKIIVLNSDTSLRWSLEIPNLKGCYGGLAAADLDGDGRAEIIANNQLLKISSQGELTVTQLGVNTNNCTSFAASLDTSSPDLQIISGTGVFNKTGDLLWEFPDDYKGGYLAAADIDESHLGVEVISVSKSRVAAFDGVTGSIIWSTDVPREQLCGTSSSKRGEYIGHGGPPAVGDFDGDKALDIAVATGKYYTVFKGNGEVMWKDHTRDCSSSITGSSLFDFNGDGKPEILYQDELFLKIYDGRSGSVQFKIPNPSGTLLENPIVVDVDGNGSSELVIATNNYMGESFYADAGELASEVKNVIPGIRVFESKSKQGWVPTRSVWNQYAYFVNNVTDDLKATSSTATTKAQGASLFRQNLIRDLEEICK